jgi:hypothetical protein
LNLASYETVPFRLEGSDHRFITQPRSVYTLSQDGRTIYFALHPDAPGEQSGNNGYYADLFKVAAGGGRPELIVRFPGRVYGLSPYGSAIGLLVVTDRGGAHNDLWHVPFEEPEKNARKLTFGQADEDSASSNSSGRWLIYSENSSGTTRVVQQEGPDGEARTVRITGIEYGRPTGSLRIKLVDQEKGSPVARISVQEKGGKFHAPSGALYRVTAGLGHFYANGAAELDVPVGSYRVRVFRGPEYRMFEHDFDISQGERQDMTVNLQRWTHAAARGWYSGENHIHANYGYGAWYNTPATIHEQCTGEDLNVANLVVANSDGDGVYDREFFTGRSHPLSTKDHILAWNQEFRSTIWGHMTLFNLSHLVEPIFTGFKGTTNPYDIPTNADITTKTNAQGGFTSYTHPTNSAEDAYSPAYSAKGLPVDVALGKLDTIDVMGGGYEPSLLLWYRLLNCGFRLPAAAGTDCFVNRVASAVPGWGRAYVHLPKEFTYDTWVRGLKAGRSFISNGPMIELSVGEAAIGDTIGLERATRIRVRGGAESQFPLGKLELIYNGKAVAIGELAVDKLSATLDQEIVIEDSGWIALRTSGPAVPYWLGGARAAHTSPVYVTVPGRPTDARSDAEYFLAWIDRLEAALKQRDRMHTGAGTIEAQLNAAREVFLKLTAPAPVRL